jgi:hypothetical protein
MLRRPRLPWETEVHERLELGAADGEHGALLPLTMRVWRHVIAGRGLLRPLRAYCPWCYADMLRRGKPVVDPLVWALYGAS